MELRELHAHLWTARLLIYQAVREHLQMCNNAENQESANTVCLLKPANESGLIMSKMLEVVNMFSRPQDTDASKYFMFQMISSEMQSASTHVCMVYVTCEHINIQQVYFNASADAETCRRSAEIMCGVPQGSILGAVYSFN